MEIEKKLKEIIDSYYMEYNDDITRGHITEEFSKCLFEVGLPGKVIDRSTLEMVDNGKFDFRIDYRGKEFTIKDFVYFVEGLNNFGSE